jgi:hypothetical protein
MISFKVVADLLAKILAAVAGSQMVCKPAAEAWRNQAREIINEHVTTYGAGCFHG